MTDIEKYVRLILDNVYTSLPCEVMEYDGNTRFAKCKLLVATSKDAAPLIRVPILRMVGGSVPLKVGMRIPVWFTKYSLGDFLTSLSTQNVKSALECYQFTRDSAYGLPFLFDDNLNIKMPEFVEFDTKVIFKEDVVMEKTLDVADNSTFKKNVTISDKISASNYDKHTHITGKEGQPTGTPSE